MKRKSGSEINVSQERGKVSEDDEGERERETSVYWMAMEVVDEIWGD